MAATKQSADKGSLFTPDGLATHLNIHPDTVRNWRFKKKGPPYLVVAGNCIRYSRKDVDTWLNAKRVTL